MSIPEIYCDPTDGPCIKLQSPDGLTVKTVGIDDDGNLTLNGVASAADAVFCWNLNGQFQVSNFDDGARIMHRDGTIVSVAVVVEQQGKDGNNIFDILKHAPTKPITTQRSNTAGTTIYTTEANRPTIAGGTNSTKTDNAIIQAAAPDVTTFSAGDFFSVSCIERAASAQVAVIIMAVRYN
jgi:hypothetical protein